MNNSKEKQISIVGLGYVGLPLALLADSEGYKVTGIDVDTKKTEQINNKISPFKDKEITEQLKSSKINASTDFSKIKNSSIIIICVPTPVHTNHMPNLKFVENASTEIGKNLKVFSSFSTFTAGCTVCVKTVLLFLTVITCPLILISIPSGIVIGLLTLDIKNS